MITLDLMKLEQTPSMLPQLLVRTVDTQIISDTGSNVQKVFPVNSKKPHHPPAAIISVWLVKKMRSRSVGMLLNTTNVAITTTFLDMILPVKKVSPAKTTKMEKAIRSLFA